jgi:Spy/CpxP family protein refolding chaperone
MKTSRLLGLLAVALASSGLRAEAQSQAQAPASRFDPALAISAPGFLDEIDLDDDQTYQVARLRSVLYAKTALPRLDVKTKTAELEALWKALPPKKDVILKKSAEIEALYNQIRMARIEYAVGVLQILTPKQRSQLPASLLSQDHR